jgi:hypothetical protein
VQWQACLSGRYIQKAFGFKEGGEWQLGNLRHSCERQQRAEMTTIPGFLSGSPDAVSIARLSRAFPDQSIHPPIARMHK